MKKNNTKGFTLIELLTVIGILSIVGTIVVLIVSVTFRGIKKSDLIQNAQQNGDIALSLIVKNIRYAQPLDTDPTVNACFSGSAKSITINSLADNGQTKYSCSGGTVASNSADLIDTSQFQVKSGSCSITCVKRTSVDPPTVTIQFTLEQKNSGKFAESTFTPIPFQSSVTLRNQ